MVKTRRKSRLPEAIQRALITQFVAGVPARTAAAVLDLNRPTVTLYFHKLREVIAAHLAEEAPLPLGEVEVDESYFGGFQKGKRGRGAGGKVMVFGLLKRAGKVYVAMPSDASSKTLVGIIRQRVQPDSIVYTDSFPAYNILDVSEFHHHRINHRESFGDGPNHINGIENFWNQAKRHLRRYNGVPKTHFYLFLKECEWRFNYRPASNLLRVLSQWTGLED